MIYILSKQLGEAAKRTLQPLREEEDAKRDAIYKHYKEEVAKINARQEKKLSKLKNEYKTKIEAAEQEIQKDMFVVVYKNLGYVMTEGECRNLPNIPEDELESDVDFSVTVPKNVKIYRKGTPEATELAKKFE